MKGRISTSGDRVEASLRRMSWAGWGEGLEPGRPAYGAVVLVDMGGQPSAQAAGGAAKRSAALPQDSQERFSDSPSANLPLPAANFFRFSQRPPVRPSCASSAACFCSSRMTLCCCLWQWPAAQRPGPRCTLARLRPVHVTAAPNLARFPDGSR